MDEATRIEAQRIAQRESEIRDKIHDAYTLLSEAYTEATFLPKASEGLLDGISNAKVAINNIPLP